MSWRPSLILASWAPLALAIAGGIAIWTPASPELDLSSIRMTAGSQPVSQLDMSALADQVTARPLFDRSRRPLPRETAQAPITEVASVQQRPTLAGILAGQDGQIALLRFNGTREMQRATQGAEISGWEVLEIGAASVTIRDDTGTEHVLPIGR